ncbi:MAG: hypothetical protein D6752_03580 [Candidatus Nitrosothermus koennekii]|nr:MAG: hypothetical protein D6752_03580 [Candidatus Nitrosothermus koennekii]
MEEEQEYIESDIVKIMLEHLHELGYDAELIPDLKGPYYSYYFSGSQRIVDSICCIKIKGMEFDCMQILARG